jgi:hypothetical protein
MPTSEKEEVNKIWTKIQKLLALQESAEKLGSIQEATNAAEKVQRLLLKYNLSLSELEHHAPKKLHEVNVPSSEWGYNPREGHWAIIVVTVVADFFLCRSIQVKTKGDRDFVSVLIGKPHNIEVAKHAIKNLLSSIRHFAKQAYKQLHKSTNTKKGAFYRQYYMGAALGVRTNLENIKRQREFEANQSTTTAQNYLPIRQVELTAQSELQEYLEKNYADLQTRNHKAIKNTLATIAGYQKGLELTPQTSIGE